MSQLTTLLLSNFTPAISLASLLIPEPQQAVTLPSLTHLDISASAKDCTRALAHLVLPALISLRVTSQLVLPKSGSVRFSVDFPEP
jgi:hypothetical protein